MYIYIYVIIHICIYICTHIHIHMQLYNVCIYICTCLYVRFTIIIDGRPLLPLAEELVDVEADGGDRRVLPRGLDLRLASTMISLVVMLLLLVLLLLLLLLSVLLVLSLLLLRCNFMIDMDSSETKSVTGAREKHNSLLASLCPAIWPQRVLSRP